MNWRDEAFAWPTDGIEAGDVVLRGDWRRKVHVAFPRPYSATALCELIESLDARRSAEPRCPACDHPLSATANEPCENCDGRSPVDIALGRTAAQARDARDPSAARRRLLDAGGPGRFDIQDGHLVVELGEGCTCDPDPTGTIHQRWCGTEPVMTVAQLRSLPEDELGALLRAGGVRPRKQRSGRALGAPLHLDPNVPPGTMYIRPEGTETQLGPMNETPEEIDNRG